MNQAGHPWLPSGRFARPHAAERPVQSLYGKFLMTKAGSVVQIAPGLAFRPGVKPWGLDVVKVLDEISVSQ